MRTVMVTMAALGAWLERGGPGRPRTPGSRRSCARSTPCQRRGRSPHIKWGRPYAKGAIRALCFQRSARHERAAGQSKLIQRFDVQAQAVYRRLRSKAWLGGEAGVKRLERLMGGEHDVYVFWKLSPALLTGPARATFDERVGQGVRAVVLVGGRAGDLITSGRPLKPRPSWLTAGDAYAVGKGRVVVLPRQEDVAYEFGWHVAYDHRIEQVGRAVVWAAGREPTMRLGHGGHSR